MRFKKEQEVWDACDNLIAEGLTAKQITGEVLGNKLRNMGLKAGSLTYRYRYRDSWMTERGQSRENLENKDIKSDIIEKSAAIFRNSLRKDLEIIYEAKYQKLEKENQSLTVKCNKLEKKYNCLANVHKDLRDSYKILKEKNHRLQLELSSKSAELDLKSNILSEKRTIEGLKKQLLSLDTINKELKGNLKETEQHVIQQLSFLKNNKWEK